MRDVVVELHVWVVGGVVVVIGKELTGVSRPLLRDRRPRTAGTSRPSIMVEVYEK